MRLSPFSHKLFILVRVGVLCLLALTAFWLTALLVALAVAWIQDVPFTAGHALYPGIVCGLAAWLFVAVFHLRNARTVLTFQDTVLFVGQLKAQLEELGYKLRQQSDDRLVFRPQFQSLLFGTGVEAQLGRRSATLYGPKLYLELLRRRWRVQNHIDKVHNTPRALKRVELSLRVPRQHWEGVYAEVIMPFIRDGAQVLCNVNLLV
jgi:hypothetical protein